MAVPLTRPEADRPMTFCRQLRLTTIQALKRIPGIKDFQSPGDWTTPPEKLPAILVRAPKDRKESKGTAGPFQFTTTSTIEIEARLQEDTEEKAQDSIEALMWMVEKFLLREYSMGRIVEQIASVQTDIEITATGKLHIAGLKMTVECQGYEVFDVTAEDPAVAPWPLPQPDVVDLLGARITLDTVDPSDKTGTYPDPAFPDSVKPAPRTEGPDGRAEGQIDVTLEGAP